MKTELHFVGIVSQILNSKIGKLGNHNTKSQGRVAVNIDAVHTFLSFFILDGGHLPFFLSFLLRRSRLRRCLSFLASFIRALCSMIIFCFDSSGMSSILVAGFGSSGCSAPASEPSAVAWTRSGLFSVKEAQVAVTIRGLCREDRFLHCSLEAATTVITKRQTT